MTQSEHVVLTVGQAHDVLAALRNADSHLEPYEAHLRRVATSLELPGAAVGVQGVVRARDDLTDAQLVVQDALSAWIRANRPVRRTDELWDPDE